MNNCELKISGKLCSGPVKKCLQCGKKVCLNCARKFCTKIEKGRECDYVLCSNACVFYSEDTHKPNKLEDYSNDDNNDDGMFINSTSIFRSCTKCDYHVHKKTGTKCENCGARFCPNCDSFVKLNKICLECEIKLKNLEEERCVNCGYYEDKVTCNLCYGKVCIKCRTSGGCECNTCGLVLCNNCKYRPSILWSITNNGKPIHDEKNVYIKKEFLDDKNVKKNGCCIDCIRINNAYDDEKITDEEYEEIIEYLKGRKFWHPAERNKKTLIYMLPISKEPFEYWWWDNYEDEDSSDSYDYFDTIPIILPIKKFYKK